MTTGAISSALDGGADPAFAARIESVASGSPGIEAKGLPASAAAPAAAAAPQGVGWQVQVGAFRNGSAVESRLRALQDGIPELALLTAVRQRRGDLIRARIGGIEDEAAARRLCERILAAGPGCFVVRPGS